MALLLKDCRRRKGCSMAFRTTKSATEMTAHLWVQPDLGKPADLQVEAVRQWVSRVLPKG